MKSTEGGSRMSWITKLNEAYECGMSGKSDLIPIGFTQKEVRFHVILRADGSFDHAEEFPKKTFLVVPTSPKAEARTGDTGTPFPLAEQLKYLVMEEGHDNPRYPMYMKALKEWCEEQDAPGCLRVLYAYLEQKTLLADLTEKAGLKVKYSKDNGYGKGDDAKAFIVFSVHSADGEDRLWEREDVRNSWSKRLSKVVSDHSALCYADGTVRPVMESHPKIQGNAKLVSAKDNEYPFLYKGRFSEDGSAAAVGYETAAKAYQALDWLIGRQGFRRYGMTLVAWNTNGAPIPVPLEGEDDEEEILQPDTFEAYGEKIRDEMLGRRRDLEAYNKKRANEVVILGMEAATDGRMSINYYREIPDDCDGTNDYAARLTYWYETCMWERFDGKTKKTLVFTPSPHRIAEAVMGLQKVREADADNKAEKSASKEMRALMLRLLDCITQKRDLPRDIVRSAFERAVQPQLFRKPGENTWWEKAWRDSVAVTCALIRKRRLDGGSTAELTDAALMEQNRDRSYLFGRLLAIADFAEYASEKDGKMTNSLSHKPASVSRPNEKNGKMTNALSLMPAFVSRPAETWLRLHGKLIPYFGKLPHYKANLLQNWLGQIESLFLPGDRMKKEPLGEMFLPGYYSQRQALFAPKGVTSGEPFAWQEDRSILYGYLAAIAEHAELQTGDKSAGSTNVLNASEMLVRHPVGSWAALHGKTIPYLAKNGRASRNVIALLRTCEACFRQEERDDDSELDSGFLHGYYTMRFALNTGTVGTSSVRSEATSKTRDDVFGELLALENRVERRVMDGIQRTDGKDYRLSNAFRYFGAVSGRPWSSWTILKAKLLPYLKKLPGEGKNVLEKIDVLETLIHENEWDNDIPLKGTCLHNFYTK